MSYDLYFKSRDGATRPDVNDLLQYFRGRKNYKESHVQAFYQNEDTGVYFSFDFAEQEIDGQAGLLPVAFNLNYFRPHIFGLEAEPEVRGLVEAFQLQVFDPQNEGMGEGDYSTEDFLAGWNHGNEFAYSAILKRQRDQVIFTLTTAQIESCWRWNAAKNGLQRTFGEAVFVPRIFFFERDGKPVSTVVWPDGISIAMPEVDTVYIGRKRILPRRLFGSNEDFVIAPWSEVEPIVREFPVGQGLLPYHLLKYDTVPEPVMSQLRNFRATREKPNGIPVEKILDAEMVESARRKMS